MFDWLQGKLRLKRTDEPPLPVDREARAIAEHFEAMRTANERRLASFKANGRFIKGVRWLGTLDASCCVVCAALDGVAWDLDGKPLGNNPFHFHAPPLHDACRCVLSPIPKSEPDDGPTIGARASKDGPLPAGTTFADFLKCQSPDFVERVLGPERTELFLSGKLALRDCIDADCRERTIEEIRKEAARSGK